MSLTLVIVSGKVCQEYYIDQNFAAVAEELAHPTTHSHSISDVTGLQAALDGKSGVGHNHDLEYAPIGMVSFPGFGVTHDKAAYGDHTHPASDIIIQSPNGTRWQIKVDNDGSVMADPIEE